MYNLHFKCGPIDLYGESGSSGRLWITYEVLNPGNVYATVQCKSVGSNPKYLGYAFAMGTLVWKVSQILLITNFTSCYQVQRPAFNWLSRQTVESILHIRKVILSTSVPLFLPISRFFLFRRICMDTLETVVFCGKSLAQLVTSLSFVSFIPRQTQVLVLSFPQNAPVQKIYVLLVEGFLTFYMSGYTAIQPKWLKSYY